MKIEIPGKVFIAGEYGALKGFPTLSVAVDPVFTYSSNVPGKIEFHPESPAGRLPGSNTLPGQLEDPYVIGGMGKSTAEFLIKYHQQKNPSKSVVDIWSTYRKLHENLQNPPSGVDLVTQVLGGYCVTEWWKNRFETQAWSFENWDWMVGLTGHKVKTHEHLRDLKSLEWDEVGRINGKIVKAFEISDELGFLGSMMDWRKFLLKSGLEVENTTQIIEKMTSVPGVLAAKGCGALGSDAVFVLFEKGARENVEKALKPLVQKLIFSSQVSLLGMKVDYEDFHQRSL